MRTGKPGGGPAGFESPKKFPSRGRGHVAGQDPDEEGKCKESRGKPILRKQAEGSQGQVKAPAGGVRTWPQ